MKQILLRPYNFLVVFAILIVLLSFFISSNTIDFHFHDTLFVLATSHLFWLLAIMILVFAFIYRATNKLLLSNKLTWIHIITTLFSVVIIISYPIYYSPSMFIEIDAWQSFNRINTINNLLTWFAVLFLLAQLLLLINIIAGFIKKLRTKPI